MNFDVIFTVVIYNKEAKDSTTLLCLEKLLWPVDKSIKINLWNNGPNEIDDWNPGLPKNIAIELCHTLYNESLSVIYNSTIEKNSLDLFVILDDDTLVNQFYLDALLSLSRDRIGMPLIGCNGRVVNPTCKGAPVEEKFTLLSNDKIFTIGSGIAVGKDILECLKSEFGNYFDERFYFYGIDSSFCRRLHLRGLSDKVTLLPEIEHSLSRLDSGTEMQSEFRLVERGYDLGLTLKYYTPKYLSPFSLIKYTSINLYRSLFGRVNDFDLRSMYRAYITGKHYKNSE